MPRRSRRRSRQRFSGGAFGQSKTEYYIRALGNMYNPDDGLVYGIKSLNILLGWFDGYYHFSPYMEQCYQLYEHFFGKRYYLYNKSENVIIPKNNVAGLLGYENESAESLIKYYRSLILDDPKWREAHKLFKEGIHKIYLEAMAARAGPQRRSMFGHSYESIVPEE
jgi:hypothetical protein